MRTRARMQRCDNFLGLPGVADFATSPPPREPLPQIAGQSLDARGGAPTHKSRANRTHAGGAQAPGGTAARSRTVCFRSGPNTNGTLHALRHTRIQPEEKRPWIIRAGGDVSIHVLVALLFYATSRRIRCCSAAAVMRVARRACCCHQHQGKGALMRVPGSQPSNQEGRTARRRSISKDEQRRKPLSRGVVEDVMMQTAEHGSKTRSNGCVVSCLSRGSPGDKRANRIASCMIYKAEEEHQLARNRENVMRHVASAPPNSQPIPVSASQPSGTGRCSRDNKSFSLFQINKNKSITCLGCRIGEPAAVAPTFVRSERGAAASQPAPDRWRA